MRDVRCRLLALAGAMLLIVPGSVSAQNPVTINGRVTNEAGTPLPYAGSSVRSS